MYNNNANQNFKGQLADEKVICFTRKHWLRTIPLFASLIILIASPLLLTLVFDKKSIIESLSQGGFFALAAFYVTCTTYMFHLVCVRIFNYYLRILIVTNQRIVDLKKTLFLCDNRSTVMLSEIQDISMNKDGLMQTIFNFGTINVVVSGNSQPMLLKHIPNPDYHFRKMIKSRQEYIANLAGMRQQAPTVILPTESIDARPLVLPTFNLQ